MSIGRGIPAAGKRLTLKRRMQGWTYTSDGTLVPPPGLIPDVPFQLGNIQPTEPKAPVKVETDEEIDARISERFGYLRELTSNTISGTARSLIVSGPPGLGKSYDVEALYKQADPEKRNHTIVKGFVRPTGLYKLFYDHRGQGQSLILDDADSVFGDDVSLSLLKAVCDTTEDREVSWRAETRMTSDKTEENLPTSFLFEGAVVFISNTDFDDVIEKGGRLAPHLDAMISRSHFLDTTMRTRRDYIIRVKQVAKMGLFKNKGLDEAAQGEIIEFMEEHKDALRRVCLRTALKIANFYKPNSDHWRNMAKATLCKARFQ